MQGDQVLRGAAEAVVDQLTSRDKVARAMTARMLEQGTDHLWLDATGLDAFDERFPTMKALLEALEKDPAVARRRRAMTLAAALLPIAVGLGVRQSVASHQSVCASGADRLAGVWELTPPGVESPRQASMK